MYSAMCDIFVAVTGTEHAIDVIGVGGVWRLYRVGFLFARTSRAWTVRKH